MIVMFPPKLLRGTDVFVLALLRAAEEQMDLKVYLPEIDAIAGAEIQSQLRDAFANWLDIAKYAVFKAINANADSGSGLNVEAIEPIRKWFAAGLVLTNENFSGSGFQIRWATSHCVTFKSRFKRSTILR